jgi:hypothetical protein
MDRVRSKLPYAPPTTPAHTHCRLITALSPHLDRRVHHALLLLRQLLQPLLYVVRALHVGQEIPRLHLAESGGGGG